MKKTILTMVLVLVMQVVMARDVIITQNVELTAKELGVTCQKLDVAKDACVIAHFKKNGNNGEVSTEPSDIYRVLNGKMGKDYYVATDYYNNGQQQTTPIVSKNGSAVLKEYCSCALAENLEHPWIEWSKNGKKISEATMNKAGHLTGRGTTWDETSNLRSVGYYKYGKPTGVWVMLDENDAQIGQITYKNNNGWEVVVRWGADEKTALKFNYVNGQGDGLWQAWHKNGNQAFEGICKQGLPHGNWKYWSSDGKPLDKKGYPDEACTSR